MRLVDSVKIYLNAGCGGDGCVSFSRGPNLASGKPDGGNGGAGGNILVQVDSNKTSLLSYRYQQHFVAERGESGKGRNKSGGKGRDTIISVPMGTQMLMEDGKTLIRDFSKAGEQMLLLHGGRGGQGNASCKSSQNRSPKVMQRGEKGESLWIWLKLKIPAHVAVVGFANSGKSTYFNTFSRARSQVAEYPHTTKSPRLGNVTVDYQDWILMDTPPLGERMLQHLERCIGFIYVVSALKQDLELEVEKIRETLSKNGSNRKPFILVLTMTNLLDPKALEEKAAGLKHPFITSSSIDKEKMLKYFSRLRERVS